MRTRPTHTPPARPRRPVPDWPPQPRVARRPATRRWAVAAVVAGLLAATGAVACGRDGGSPPQRPLPTPPSPTLPERLADRVPKLTDTPTAAIRTTPPVAGIRYRLPAQLCAKSDLTPLKDLYPMQQETPLVDSPGLCDTSVRSTISVVGITVNAELLPDPAFGHEYYTTARRLARGTRHDIAGAGSAAFWTGVPDKVELVTYHGNLALHITAATIGDRDKLPDGIPARLARIAAGTYANLTP